MVFVVSGPSGCGKSTLIRKVRRSLDDLEFSVSHTTRPPRPSEKDGVDYHFVPVRTFERMVRARRFLEWARVHGHLYGTSRAEVERKGRRRDVVLDIDVQGARQVKQRLPDAVAVFVLPPSQQELEHRLRARGLDAPEAVQRRLQCARDEIESSPDIYDYLVVNRSLEETCAQVQAIVVAERARRRGQSPPPEAAAQAAAARRESTKSEVSAILETFAAHGV